MGATALASPTGHKGPLHAVRGRIHTVQEGRRLLVTVHPSCLLRLPDADAQACEFKRFTSELSEGLRLAQGLAAANPMSSPDRLHA